MEDERVALIDPITQDDYGAIPTNSHAFQHNHDGDSSSDGFHCHGERLHDELESNTKAKTILWISIGICLFFMICEVVGGLMAGSLAIITDAAHLLTDLASMLISLFSLYLASRPASQRMSFGWHRAEVVGAFISVFMIWVVTGVLVYLAVERMISKNYEIQGLIMVITAGLGVIVNLIMGMVLYYGGHSHSHSHGMESLASSARSRTSTINSNYSMENGDIHHHGGGGHKETNINVRAAFIHVLGDLIQSVGVLIAAILILVDNKLAIMDPICTLVFSVIVLVTTFWIVRDALVVLLEGRPSNIDFRTVFDALERIPGVKKVHDLRIWALTMNKISISVHLEIDPNESAQEVLRKTTIMLRKKFNVHESTVQIEGYLPDREDCVQCVPPS